MNIDMDTKYIYEYGYDKGWLPNGAFGCTQNLTLATAPAFLLNGFTQIISFPNPVYWADNPYFDPNYESARALIIE